MIRDDTSRSLDDCRKKKKNKKCKKCLRGNERRLVEDKSLDGYDVFIKFDLKCSGVVVLKKKSAGIS